MTFPYFVMKKAPVSGVESLMNYQATIFGEHRKGRTDVWLKVVVPTTSLCPCSKKISDYGAHNQRSHITLTAKLNEHMWLEELIDVAEAQASCEVYGILTRPDEKARTSPSALMTIRNSSRTRCATWPLRSTATSASAPTSSSPRISSESIHNHSAYAMIEHDKDAPLSRVSLRAA